MAGSVKSKHSSRKFTSAAATITKSQTRKKRPTDSPMFGLGANSNKSSARLITLPQHHTSCAAKVAEGVISFSLPPVNSRKN